MKTLWIIAILVCGSPALAVDISHDDGGYVLEYAFRAKQYEDAGEPIRILGSCKSACTIYTASSTACVGPHAVLGFHAATHPRATQYLMDNYPESIRKWILAKGGLTRRMIYLRGKALRAHVPSC